MRYNPGVATGAAIIPALCFSLGFKFKMRREP